LFELGTKAIIVCYGIGYLIETTYDSVFGVYDLELIRTRALFSGISCVLLSIFVFLALKIGEEWRYVSLPWRYLFRELERHEGAPRGLTFLINCAAKFTVLVELTQLGQYLFLLIYLPIDRVAYGEINGQSLVSWLAICQKRHFFTLLAYQTFCLFGLFVTWQFLIRKSARIAAGVTTLFCIGYVVTTKLIGDVPMGSVTWLAVVLVSIKITQQYSKNRTSAKWKLLTLSAFLASTLVYARLVYPRMLPWLGGPPRATVLITCGHGCSVSGKKMRLVEETNDGYYLVPYDTQESDATFIARGKVEEVIFMASPKFLAK